jgi:hypothetical protein
MSNEVISYLVFFGIGAYCFFLYYFWFQYLVRLARNTNKSEINKIAARRYPIVIILLAVLILAGLAFIIRLGAISKVMVLVLFLLSICPNIYWWLKKWPVLQKLGYGRGMHT